MTEVDRSGYPVTRRCGLRKIKLTKGKVALVSDEDYEYLSQFRWYASHESRGTKWYAIRWERKDGKQRKVRMHRVVAERMGILKEPLQVVDHLNHKSLDNRRGNLEATDQNENMHRSPGWKGSRSWKQARRPTVEHRMGDRHEVDGVLCEVKFINAGKAWVFPIVDDPDDSMVARHICYGKVNEYGEASGL